MAQFLLNILSSKFNHSGTNNDRRQLELLHHLPPNLPLNTGPSSEMELLKLNLKLSCNPSSRGYHTTRCPRSGTQPRVGIQIAVMPSHLCLTARRENHSSRQVRNPKGDS